MKTTTTSVLLAASLSVFLGCTSKEEAHNVGHSEHPNIVTIAKGIHADIGLDVIRVQRQSLGRILKLPARVIAHQDHEARIGSLVAGRVHQVFVKAGDPVRRGDVLMTLEGLDIGEIKAGYLKAKATFEYARAAWERQTKLFEDKIGSQKALLEAKSEYEKAQAEYRAEDRRIHSVGLSDEMVESGSIDEHTAGTLPIRSPIDGIVAERNVVLGQYVEATTNAFTILNTKTVWVDAQIYEKDIDLIESGTVVNFVAEGRPALPANGRIIFVGSTVDERTRTITVRGEFSNPGLKLKPQMFGELTAHLKSHATGISIPTESIVRDGEQGYVFVQTSDSTFERRDIVTGMTIGGNIEVRSGLLENEAIVTNGVFYLKSELQKEEIEGDEH